MPTESEQPDKANRILLALCEGLERLILVVEAWPRGVLPIKKHKSAYVKNI